MGLEHTHGGAQNSGARNSNLDLLRLLSCCAVIGLHTMQQDLNPTLYSLCGFAIPAFFMASGCVLLNREELAPGYVARKIAGILRIVVLWSLCRGLAGFALKLALHGGVDRQMLLAVLRNVADGILVRGKLRRFWYMVALLLVYCALPALRRISRTNRRALWCTWGVFAAASVAVQVASMLCGIPLQERVPQSLRLWTWLQYFLLGGCAVRLLPRMTSRISTRAHALLLLLWTALAVAWWRMIGSRILGMPHMEFFYDSVLCMIWCALLFTLVLRLPLSDRVRRGVARIAPLTLGVYILHFDVLPVAARLLPMRTAPMALVYFGMVAVASFAVIAALSKIKPAAKYLLKI